MKAPYINLQDVAHRANVPSGQVAKVVLGQPDVPVGIRRRVVDALREAGLADVAEAGRPAAMTIGIAVPQTKVDDYIGQVSLSIAETITRHGYTPVSIDAQNPTWEHELTRLMRRGGCSGMVMIVPNSLHRLLDLCRQFDRPFVLVDYQGGDDISRIPTVEVNNRQSMVEVMRHLLELGHRRIGFMTGRLDHASAHQRLRGYRDALSEADIPYDPNLVVVGDWESALAYEQAKILLRLADRPTAIAASNDLSALGAIRASSEAGLEIGKDISITGFDDIPQAARLTTIRQPMHRLGQTAADMLLNLLAGKPVSPLHVHLDTELMIRESTGKPRSNDRL
jgi:LacI family transcriptional regulator